VAHAFLSDAWFKEAERIRNEINPPVPDVIKNIVVNLVVKNGPEGDVEARIQGGKFEKGLAASAPTKLTVPYDVAKAMFISGDQQASMQAFMTGQIQVEGDMGVLMQMQMAGTPSAEAVQLQERVKGMTA
jgi:putative sterol carrier protein